MSLLCFNTKQLAQNLMLLGVVIPVYNRAPGLRLTLESLIAQTKKDFTVVVADDGSTDGSREVVEELKSDFGAKQLNWVSCGPNLGVRTGRARNIGAANLPPECKYMVMLDCDMLLPSNALALFGNAQERHPHSVIMGMFDWLPPLNLGDLIEAVRQGRVAELQDKVPSDAPQRIEGTFVGMDLREWLWPGLFNVDVHRLLPMQPEWAYSNNVCYPIELFRQVGGFDERMRGYGYQDIEFGTRIAQLGPTCILWSQIRSLHAWHQRTDRRVRLYEVQRNLDYLFRKHGYNQMLAGDIDWSYWRHYHRLRGGQLVVTERDMWVVNEPHTHRLLLPSEDWARRLGFCLANDKHRIDDFTLAKVRDAGVAADVLPEDVEYSY